jgi:arylsulfatase A-like enzyme
MPEIKRRELTRRAFVAGCAVPAVAADRSVPQPVQNPNILVIIVDQMRSPVWLDSSQTTQFRQKLMPGLYGSIVNRSVAFSQYYTAAAACTPARSTMLTGLYTPQTGIYLTQTDSKVPALSSTFPTWGRAIAEINPLYAANVWWFGKWHLSAFLPQPNPLAAYGFRTTTYPSAVAGSPFGWPNQGANGGVFLETGGLNGQDLASDAEIADSFIDWAGSNSRSGPWCATVSFINPHDISGAPNWLNPSLYPAMAGKSANDAHFPPPGPLPASLKIYSVLPSPWNFEQPDAPDSLKPSLQLVHWSFQNAHSGQLLTDTARINALNYYYYFHANVDRQIQRVLLALPQEVLDNTVIVFTSDHGEHGLSHGLRGKGGGVYEEGIHVPLFVRFPSSTGASARSQLVSSVDLFGLLCDLATGGTGEWQTRYPDLSGRESIYNFVFNPSLAERNRIVTAAGLAQPYILHTVDELESSNPRVPVNNSHVTSIRLKSTGAAGRSGGKFARYANWLAGTDTPASAGGEEEFYDYGNSRPNANELGNDVGTTDSNSQRLVADLRNVLTAKGQTELRRALVGSGLDAARQASVNNYLRYIGQMV